MEEKMEAIDRMRAHGLTLQQGAPHQVSIGNDIILLCDMAAVHGKPADPTNAQQLEEMTRITNDMARVIAERDEALGKVTENGVMMGALLFIARSRFAPDDNPFMVLLRKTARDALDEAGIDWSEVDPAQLTLPPMEPLSAAAKPTGGRGLAAAGVLGGASEMGLAAVGVLGGASETGAIGTGGVGSPEKSKSKAKK